MRDFIAVDKWIEEERKRHAIAHERRIKTEAMRRMTTKYKRIHSYSEYILNSVYTYSSVAVINKKPPYGGLDRRLLLAFYFFTRFSIALSRTT